MILKKPVTDSNTKSNPIKGNEASAMNDKEVEDVKPDFMNTKIGDDIKDSTTNGTNKNVNVRTKLMKKVEILLNLI